eukprot:1446244-Amphidinium_carterae.1
MHATAKMRTICEQDCLHVWNDNLLVENEARSHSTNDSRTAQKSTRKQSLDLRAKPPTIFKSPHSDVSQCSSRKDCCEEGRLCSLPGSLD